VSEDQRLFGAIYYCAQPDELLKLKFLFTIIRGNSKPKLGKCSRQLCSYQGSLFPNHLHFSLLNHPIPNPNPNPQHKGRTQSQGIIIIMTVITGPTQISIAAFVARTQVQRPTIKTQLIFPAPNKTQMPDFPIING
jgi:hypothetical protein